VSSERSTQSYIITESSISCQHNENPMWSSPFKSDIPQYGYAQHDDVANVDACMAMCLADPNCQAIEWKTNAQCRLFDNQNDANPQVDDYFVYKLTRQFTDSPSCSRTRTGGCGNYATQTLSREFKDRAYSTQQCHVLCESTEECGGFFFGTSTNHCMLVRSGCTPTEDAAWDYYSMDDCAYPVYALGEKGRGAQGCPAGYGWIADGEMCEEGLNYLKIPIQSVSSSGTNACYKDNQGKGYNNGNDGAGASYICKLY